MDNQTAAVCALVSLLVAVVIGLLAEFLWKRLAAKWHDRNVIKTPASPGCFMSNKKDKWI